MKIRILGTKGDITCSAEHYSKNPGLLIDQKILMDLGEKEYLNYRPKCIFVTHLHPDHAIFMRERIGKLQVPIYAPETSDAMPSILPMPSDIYIDSYRISSIPIHHTKDVTSVAYLVENSGRRVFYTGDITSIDKKFHNQMKNLDLVITDGSLMNGTATTNGCQNERRHSNIPILVSFFGSFTSHILFIHFGRWFYKDLEKSRRIIESLGNGIKVDAAFDGMEIEINQVP